MTTARKRATGRGEWLLVGLGALLLAAGACSGGDDGAPRPPLASGGPAGPTSSSGGGEGSGQGGGGAGGGGTGGGQPTAEDCHDNIDNDQNGATDCIDPDPACTEACANPCAAAKLLADPTELYVANNEGYAAFEDGGFCAGGGGAVQAFRVVSANDGMLDVRVDSLGPNLTLSLRSACDDPMTILGCSEQAANLVDSEHLRIEVTKGATVAILVEGYSASEAGAYRLSVASHPKACGDGMLDPGEACEDGNTESGDGCSATCVLESSESGDNDTLQTADVLSESTYFGAIDPVDDVDFVAIDVPGPHYSLRAQVTDLGSDACTLRTIDPVATLYGPDQAELATVDDLLGSCPRIDAHGLASGTHYLAIRRSEVGHETFAYRLRVELEQCGDGHIAGAEQCDDGNLTAGDGCSPECRLE